MTSSRRSRRPREPVALPVAAVSAPNRPSRGQVIGWFGAIAAAVVLSVVATTFLIGSRVDEQLAAQDATVEALEKLTTATLDVTGEPDAQRVALTGVTDPKLDGSLVFSPATTELVVVSYDLANPPAGQEYRCWVEVNGQRERVGKMFFSNDLAYWAGDVPAVSGLSGPATFGVSLVDAVGPVHRDRSGAHRPPLIGRSALADGRWVGALVDGDPIDRRTQPVVVPIAHRARLIRRRRLEIDPMEVEQALGCLGRHVIAVLGHDRG